MSMQGFETLMAIVDQLGLLVVLALLAQRALVLLLGDPAERRFQRGWPLRRRTS